MIDDDDRNLPDVSPKSRAVALTVGAVLGLFGGHRYYLGKWGTGVLQTVTVGGLGFWWMYDMILLAFGSFRDGDGLRVQSWWEEGELHAAPRGRQLTSAEVLDELYALREEVTELNDRVDFTERLLARAREQGSLGPGAQPHENTPV